MYGLKSAGVASGRAHVCGWWASVPSWKFLTKTPVLEASPSRHTPWPWAVWPGRALCSCLAGSSSKGQRCLLQCSVPHELELLWHLSACCHRPKVCLFITPAVPRAAWARGVIDLFTRRFPCGRRVVARTFIFCRGRWQRGCVCVCQPKGLSHSPPSARGQWRFPFPGGVRCQPVSTGHLTSLYIALFFFPQKSLRDGDGKTNFLCNQWKVKSISPHQFCFHCWLNLSSPSGRALHSHSVPGLGVVWLLAQWCMTHLFS